MFFNFVVVIVLALASNVLSATSGVSSAASIGCFGNPLNLAALPVPASRIEMLSALLTQQPLDTQRLQRMAALYMRHKHLARSKRLSDQLAAQEIENDPEYVPKLFRVLDQIVIGGPFEEQQIEKLLLWRITDPQGKQHWMFGTMHYLTFDNFAREARLQLEKIIDTAGIIMYKYDYEDEINLLRRQLNNSGYEQTISEAATMEQQIMARGVYNDKMMIELENFHHDISIFKAVNAATRLLSASAPDFLKYIFSSEKQRVARQIEWLEGALAMKSAYLTADTSKMKSYSLIRYAHRALKPNDYHHLWIDKIVSQCQLMDNCLIVAGHGHMTYDTKKQKSIITLLRERGFTVELVE